MSSVRKDDPVGESDATSWSPFHVRGLRKPDRSAQTSNELGYSLCPPALAFVEAAWIRSCSDSVCSRDARRVAAREGAACRRWCLYWVEASLRFRPTQALGGMSGAMQATALDTDGHKPAFAVLAPLP